MRFSHWIGPFSPYSEIIAGAKHAESIGYDGIWFPDHLMADGEDSGRTTHECWTILGAIAAQVPRLRLGSLVVGNPYRNPALVAKMAASIDQISGGRFVLGLGTGWQENEHRAYGYIFESREIRRSRFIEACDVIQMLLSQERSTFAGRYYQLDDAPLQPKPIQVKIPLLIGGSSNKLLPIVAEKADIWNSWGEPSVIAEKIKILNECCERIGRDPATIQRTAQALVYLNEDPLVLNKLRSRQIHYPHIIGNKDEIGEAMQSYVDAGVTEFVLPDFNFRNLPERIDSLDRFNDQVISVFR